jgi:dihydroorotate dehydrogenase
MRETLKQNKEFIEAEGLKSLAEFGLHTLAKTGLGQLAIEAVSGGMRIEDPRLRTTVAGLRLDNPLMVGAGWDKKGRCLDGLHRLGFAGTEVGSVLAHPQPGNDRPRLFTDKASHSVALNRFGFNSDGVEKVAENLQNQARPGVNGISLGKNKLTPHEHAPWAHAAVAERLYEYADYFAINVASPNTPGLRNLLQREPLTDIIRAVQDVLRQKGGKPLFVKTTVDLSLEDLNSVLEVCMSEGVSGIIDTNTTVDDSIKPDYGWAGQAGGVSGSDPRYRQKATERMKHITKETRGSGLARIGVGAISDCDSALERLQAGAQALQVVTAIRPSWGRVARDINMGLLAKMKQDGVNHISEYIAASA